MTLNEPIVFEPLSMQRVWGGRRLEALYHKALPHGVPIGESWELVDRPEAQSVVHRGALRGTTLNELWTGHRKAVFGTAVPDTARFPLLIKLLDARETLSVQVHPPEHLAAALGGEPKTEMWYFLHCDPTSKIYAGLREGVTRNLFEELLRVGRVEDTLHEIPVHAGDAIFIPSGRMHAIGGGNVIAEIQQNSDTTYRVFDWNRTGLDSKPRALHIEESLQSIDFSDFTPTLTHAVGETLVSCPLFEVERWVLDGPRGAVSDGQFGLFLCLEGSVGVCQLTIHPGELILIPACMPDTELVPSAPGATVLRISIPIG